MADAVIDRINPADLGLITHLYNTVFRPTLTEDELKTRLRGRHNLLAQVARIGNDAVGFLLGVELRPDTHFVWTCGVVPQMRRAGIATQLMHAAEDWARTEGYRILRFECENSIRPFLHFGIANDYDIVGIRWDSERMQNVVIFEKQLQDAE
jgi:GNAT superfamily N-acetyltransferase